MNKSRKKFYIIDGHALCYRAYYAFVTNPLTNSKGQNISAIFGFARMLYRLMDDMKPDYIAVAFDPPKRSFRFRLYPEYKANRTKMPDDLRSQIDEIKKMVEVIGIAQLEVEDFEADDILGSAARQYASDDREVVLVTGDKDAYQLVNENVKIYANTKGISEFVLYDTEEIIKKLGIPPEKVIDYMALVGDTSDNIPGVKGIGPKGALKLITEYGSLDAIYEQSDEITGKTGTLLREHRETALLSKDLVTIRCDIPLENDIDLFLPGEIRSPAVIEYFRSQEMNSIVKELTGELPNTGGKPEKKDYQCIRTIDELKDALNAVTEAGLVSVDTETTSVSPVDAEIVGVSLSIAERQGWYIPLYNQGLFSEEYPDPAASLELLKPMLEDESIKKIGQNIKYDIIILKNCGIEPRGFFFDTMIASYLLNPNDRRHNLDDLAMKHLNYKTISFKELVGTGKKAVPIYETALDHLTEYAVEDSDITLRLYNTFYKEIEQEAQKLFYDIELPLVPVLIDMEMAGVKIDRAYFQTLAEKNTLMLDEVEEKIYKDAGIAFNINSTRELAGILFDRLGLKPQKKTKTGYSTDITVLETLRGKHDIIESLISYRTLSKLKNTYIDTLPKLISDKTGRIHTSYNQTVAATGRLSSSGPNLQNIPVRDEFGKNIRRGFVPEDGFVLLSADYSQIELRLAAHLSGDERMIGAFKEGTDIHSLTASSVYGVPLDQVTDEMRRKAKTINFATIYGVSPFGLSHQAEISMSEAAEFIRLYFETYPGFRAYIDRTIESAKETGYVETMLGRRRPVPEINSDTTFRREGAERVAINTPIQGTSADMIKIAMINIHREMCGQKMKSRMIMQVHDELVFEAALDEEENLRGIIKSKMEGALPLSVPVVVDIGRGDNWEEAH